MRLWLQKITIRAVVRYYILKAEFIRLKAKAATRWHGEANSGS